MSVFISHVEENRDTAEAIAHGLQADGFSTWYYESSSVPGPTYLLQVMDAIENADAVILIISPEALGSHQIAKEVEAAHELDRPIIPVLEGITHEKYLRRRPEWRLALGAFTSIQIPREGVSTIMPKIVAGLDALGAPRGEAVAPMPAPKGRPGERKPALLRRPWLLAAPAVLLVALVAVGAVLLSSHGSPGGSAASGTTPAPGTTSPSGTASPSGVPASIPDVTQPLHKLEATLVVKPAKAVSTDTLTISYTITNTSDYGFKASKTTMTILLGASPGGTGVQLSDISQNIAAGATVRGTVYGSLPDVGARPGHQTVWIDIGQRFPGGSVGNVYPAQVPITVTR